MSYDPTCGLTSDKISCDRQMELAKMMSDQETDKLRYMILNPACTRMTQLADRVEEHNLQLGATGFKMNNTFCRVMPQARILDFPNYICEVPKK